MPPRRREHLKKHTLRLRSGDAAALDDLFPSLGHNVVIRRIIAQYVDFQRANGAAPDLSTLEVEVPSCDGE